MTTTDSYDAPGFTFTRLFVSDLRRDGLIPAALLVHPELAAIEAERSRLAQALTDAERSGPQRVNEATYVAARSAALREGRPLPPTPPTAAEVEAAQEQQRRDVAAAEDALLALGETLRCTVAAHAYEWGKAAGAKVHAARAEAAELQRQAQAAERRADQAEQYVRWIRRAAEGEVYLPRWEGAALPADDPDVVWDVTDPRVLELIAASRTGRPL